MRSVARLARIIRALGGAAILTSAAAGPSAATADVTPADLGIEIASYGPALLLPGSSLTVGLTITNDSAADARGIALVVSLTEEPLADPESLAGWASAEWTPEVREVARRAPAGTGEIPPRTSVSMTALATPTALGLGEEPWAVYGVMVEVYLGDDVVQESRTVATYLGTVPPITSVAVVATVAGSPERVNAILTAASKARASLLVDPTALAQLPDGSAADALRDVFALPAGHVDVASLARAGETSILPLALDASATADAPGADAPWIAVVSSLDRASVMLARDLGAAAILVQPGASSTVPSLGDESGPGSPALLDAGPGNPVVIAPDPGLSLAISGSGVPEAFRPAQVVANSALLAMANTDGRVLVASPGTSWILDTEHRSLAHEALAACPWNQFISLSSVLEGDTTGEALVPDAVTEPGDIPASQVGAAANRLAELGYLAASTSSPASVYQAPAANILAALSFEGRGDPEARTGVIDSALARGADVLGAVSLPRGSDLNLISSSGSVPITVTNDLDVEVTVTVVLETRSPNLRVRGRPSVTLAPGTSAQVLIPVTAVSSANVVAFVRLTDAEGHRLTPDTFVHLRVRADWGTAFTTFVGGAACLLFVGGIWRTARRGKRNTRTEPGSEPLPAGSDA
jgi:hypothetical protein